jgi:hypothetical protein
MRNRGDGKESIVTIPEVFRLQTPLFFPMKTDNLPILFNKIKIYRLGSKGAKGHTIARTSVTQKKFTAQR